MKRAVAEMEYWQLKEDRRGSASIGRHIKKKTTVPVHQAPVRDGRTKARKKMDRSGVVTDLCALGVLETFLEDIYGGLDVEVHDKIGAAGEDAEGGLTGEDVGAVCHGKYL